MKTLTKELQTKITPNDAIEILKKGNRRFVDNLKVNRNLLQQVNETRDGQHPFAVIISCMDSRTSAELVFDQGLGDIFSIRIAGNIINEDIIASAEFGCKVIGAKVIVVLGHTACGAIKGAIDDVDLGHLKHLTKKIQTCIPEVKATHPGVAGTELVHAVTMANALHGINILREKSSILKTLESEEQIKMVAGIYDVAEGTVKFFDDHS